MIDWFLAALCLLAVCGLSLVAANRAYSLVATCRLLIAVASLVTKHMLYGTWASVIVALRLRSCGTWAYLLHSMWSLPRAGIEPVSPALTGRLSLPVTLYHQRSPVFFFFFLFLRAVVTYFFNDHSNFFSKTIFLVICGQSSKSFFHYLSIQLMTWLIS